MPTALCDCGKVSFDLTGAPIASVACFCSSCRTAALAFEEAPGAPTVLSAENGVDYCLFRKDRVQITQGGEFLKAHRLAADSATERVVATCCNAPMFLDFARGHWLTLYRDRVRGDVPPVEAGIMAADLPGTARPTGIPMHDKFAPKILIKVLLSWAAMGFRRPKFTW